MSTAAERRIALFAPEQHLAVVESGGLTYVAFTAQHGDSVFAVSGRHIDMEFRPSEKGEPVVVALADDQSPMFRALVTSAGGELAKPPTLNWV